MSKDVLVAVFDLDGTITRRDTYVHFLLFCLRCKPVRLLKSPMLVVYFCMYKSRMRSNHWLKARFLRLVIGGTGEQELTRLATRFCNLTMQSNIKKDALDEILRLRDSGYKIVLATASFGFYVEEIAKALSVDELLCTTAQVDHAGRLTGEIEGLNCIGEEKARRLEILKSQKGWNSIARAYSDDMVDLPLWKMAKVALVVDPKPATEVVAGQYEYPILLWK